jgi:hypothetical protein
MSKGNPETFKEYPLSDADRQSIVSVLKEEGFSEEQLNGMTPEKVLRLYVDSMTDMISQEFSEFAQVYQKNPQFAHLIDPLIRNVNRQLKDLVDSLQKQLEKKKKG